jgi:hypothetical protein
MILDIALLAACVNVIPSPVSTVVATRAPSLTSTLTQTATRASSPTGPASTSTPALPTASATPQPDPVEQTQEAEAFCYQDPRKALDDYLTFLYQGEYEKAARLYGSTYPYEGPFALPEDLDPAERIAIYAQYLEEFCRGYSTCLKHRIVNEDILSDRSRLSEELQSLSEREVIFEVEFYQENREILEVFIPKANGFESYTTFELFVVRLNGCYKSIDTPPITA